MGKFSGEEAQLSPQMLSLVRKENPSPHPALKCPLYIQILARLLIIHHHSFTE